MSAYGTPGGDGRLGYFGRRLPWSQIATAERMLARYGVGYICEHPSILFSTGPVVPASLYPHPHGDAWAASRGDPSGRPWGRARAPPESEDALLCRLNEAYRILNEVYARHPHGGG